MAVSLAKYDARVIRAPMGGAWIVPETRTARAFLSEYFGERPEPLGPLGGEAGYIVEPYAAGDLGEALKAAGIAWEVQ